MSAGRDLDMLKTAARQAEICAAAYKGRDAVFQLARSCGARSNFRWINASYVSAAIISFDDHVHVTIVGSNDAHDIVQNLSASIDERDRFPMHAGFRQAAELIYREIMDEGAMRLIRGRKLYLGGHSAGGAIAQALASPVIAEELQACEVYAFGSPRVFSPRIAARMSSATFKIYRFNMPGDVVPHAPLRQFRKLFGGATYAHCGIDFQLHDDGDWITESPKSFGCLAARWLSVAGVYSLFRLNPLRAISAVYAKVRQNHEITRYLNAINKAIARES